jgi:hypothetical protein
MGSQNSFFIIGGILLLLLFGTGICATISAVTIANSILYQYYSSIRLAYTILVIMSTLTFFLWTILVIMYIAGLYTGEFDDNVEHLTLSDMEFLQTYQAYVLEELLLWVLIFAAIISFFLGIMNVVAATIIGTTNNSGLSPVYPTDTDTSIGGAVTFAVVASVLAFLACIFAIIQVVLYWNIREHRFENKTLLGQRVIVD